MSILRRGVLIVLFLLFIGVPGEASATYLTIVGRSTITTELTGDVLKLSGSYVIANHGDESARDVFPAFRLADWSWVGEPRELKAKEEASWSLEAQIPLEKLSCANDARCAGLGLPQRGRFPLVVTRRYRDANGYEFSAPEIVLLEIGALSAEERAVARDERVRGVMLVEEDGEEFQAEVQLRNMSDEEVQVALSYHVSRELQVVDAPRVLTLSPRSVTKGAFRIKNFSGLENSSYAVFAVCQWAEGEVRNSTHIAGTVQLKKPTKSGRYVLSIVVALVVMFSALWLFVLRPHTNPKSS